MLRILKTAARHTFEPRKTPVQNRSAVTVEAIAGATIQVLLAVGLNRLTTTRVAGPSGSFCRNTVSVPPEQASAPLRSAGGAFDQGSGSGGACVARKSRRRSEVAGGGPGRSIAQRKAGANGYIDGAICGRRRTGRRGSRAEVVKASVTSRVNYSVGRHGICSANALFGDGGRDSHGVGGWCATEDGGSLARGVAGALPGCAAKSVRSS
jgi:hypothetical protein